MMQQRRGGKARGLMQDSQDSAAPMAVDNQINQDVKGLAQDSQDSAAPMTVDNQIDLDVNSNPRLWGSNE